MRGSRLGSRYGRSGSHIQNELRAVMEPENSFLSLHWPRSRSNYCVGQVTFCRGFKTRPQNSFTHIPKKVVAVIGQWGGFVLSLLE